MSEMTKISGGVFSDAIEGGRAGAEIEMTANEIIARQANGEEYRLSYRDCQLERGGASGRMIFCRNSNRSLTIFSEDNRFLSNLELFGSGFLQEDLERLKLSRSSKRRRNLLLTFVILAFVILLGIGTYLTILTVARRAIQALPISVDKEIGDFAIENMDLQGSPVEDEVVIAAIQEMVSRLEKHAAIKGFEYHVQVIDADIVNAFALPGGQIVVYTGLIKSSKRPEQVAGVVAHEIAHVTRRHGLQRIGHSIGIAALVNGLLGDVGGLVAVAGELLELSTINKYSRDHEAEADEEGIRMLHAAGIDPLGMAEFFQVMKDTHGDLPTVVSWISTHPEHDARIDAIKKQLATLPKKKYTPLEIDWPDVLKRVGGEVEIEEQDPQADDKDL